MDRSIFRKRRGYTLSEQTFSYKHLLYEDHPNLILQFHLYMLIATVLIEYLTAFLLLGMPVKAALPLFIYNLFLNTITISLIQLGVFYIAHPVLLGSYELGLAGALSIEALIVITEMRLLMLIFRRMHRLGSLDSPVSKTRAFVIAIFANLASFILAVPCAAVLMRLSGAWHA